jgi:hypothetical protein
LLLLTRQVLRLPGERASHVVSALGKKAVFGFSTIELVLVGLIGGGMILIAVLFVFASLHPRKPKE